MIDYNGCLYLNEDSEIADFYEKALNTEGHTHIDLYENQYIFVGNEVYCWQDGFIRRVDYQTIDSEFSGIIKPRNIEQVAAIDMLKDEKTTIKLITGTWGTGKTMLLTGEAVALLEENKFDKIVWIRNNISLKDTEGLGALPGTEFEKLLPFLGPLQDHMGGAEGVMRFVERGQVEVMHLGFLRGRSIKNSIIICSEAENLTKEQLQLIIARVDEGSILLLDADCRQRDRATFEKSRGIEKMIERLKGQKLFGCVHLIKSERSETAALADLLND